MDFSDVILFIILLIIVVSVNTLIIMVIWNNVIIKKFPNSNIQKLSFWDSLGLSIFVSVLAGSGRCFKIK